MNGSYSQCDALRVPPPPLLLSCKGYSYFYSRFFLFFDSDAPFHKFSCLIIASSTRRATLLVAVNLLVACMY